MTAQAQGSAGTVLRTQPCTRGDLESGLKLALQLGLGALLLVATSGAASGEDAAAAEARRAYDFRLGSWALTASSMNPDMSVKTGRGLSNSYLTHDGEMVQDDVRVEFEDGTGFRGSTLRTWDSANQVWRIYYIAAGGTSGVGEGEGRIEAPGHAVERFGGSDEHGAYTDVLVMRLAERDRIVVQMDRHYDDGEVVISGIWSYEAVRNSPGLGPKETEVSSETTSAGD